MSNVKSLDHLDTVVIESRGWKINKVFTADPDHTLEVYDEAMEYAEQLAKDREVGFRPITKDDTFYIDVFVKSS